MLLLPLSGGVLSCIPFLSSFSLTTTKLTLQTSYDLGEYNQTPTDKTLLYSVSQLDDFKNDKINGCSVINVGVSTATLQISNSPYFSSQNIALTFTVIPQQLETLTLKYPTILYPSQFTSDKSSLNNATILQKVKSANSELNINQLYADIDNAIYEGDGASPY
jgi:hypothetical protein